MNKINVIACLSIIFLLQTNHLHTMQPTPREQASTSALNGLRPDNNEEKFNEIIALSEQMSTSLDEIKNGAQKLIRAINLLDERSATVIDQTNNLQTSITAICANIIAETRALTQALRDDR